MQKNPEIGIDLPLKIVVWKNQQGQTQIAYTNPFALKEHYKITKYAHILDKMAESLEQLVNKVIQ